MIKLAPALAEKILLLWHASSAILRQDLVLAPIDAANQKKKWATSETPWLILCGDKSGEDTFP